MAKGWEPFATINKLEPADPEFVKRSNKRFEGFIRSTKKSPSAVELKKEAEEANEVKNQQKAFLMQGFKDKKLKSKKLIKQAQAYTNTKKEEN